MEDRRPWLGRPTRATSLGAMGSLRGEIEAEIATGGGRRARQCKKTSAPLTRDGANGSGAVWVGCGGDQFLLCAEGNWVCEHGCKLSTACQWPHNNSAAEGAPRRSSFVYAKKTWLASGCGPLTLHGFPHCTTPSQTMGMTSKSVRPRRPPNALLADIRRLCVVVIARSGKESSVLLPTRRA